MGKRVVTSTNGAGRTAQPHVKDEAGLLTHAIDKKLTQNEKRPNCKSKNYKTSRRKYRGKYL